MSAKEDLNYHANSREILASIFRERVVQLQDALDESIDEDQLKDAVVVVLRELEHDVRKLEESAARFRSAARDVS